MIYSLLFVVIIICFKYWFFPGYISSGDLWPIGAHAIQNFSLWPSAWGATYGGGIGASSIPYLWNNFQYGLPIFLFGRILQLPWEYIVRFGYLFPFLIITVFSSYVLTKHFIHSSFSWIGSLIYTTNTYCLLLISGGQTGVAFGYGLAPFVLLKYIEQIDADNGTLKQWIINGLWLALLIGCDLRLAYLILGAIFLYFVIHIIGTWFQKKSTGMSLFLSIVRVFVIPGAVAVSLHLFWILPTLIYGSTATDLGQAYTNPGMLKFLSVADFSHALSFLHPNWPENLFGKVYFLQPEFLIIPFIAFCSLLFITTVKHKTHIVFFGLLALVGAFFAKGVNDPFGGLFSWCFSHIPGFVMFRDPTKFYIYIAIAYAILIPFTLSFVVDACKRLLHGKNTKIQTVVPIMLCIVFVGFWMFTIRQAVFGKIGGTLHVVTVPRDYQQFELQVSQSPELFSRTFWIPSVHRFAYPTSEHPAIDALTVTDSESASGVVNWIKESSAQMQLARWNVVYVVVPIDTDGTQFTTERVYDAAKRNEIITALDEIPWLKREGAYTDLAVWKTAQSMGHMWKNVDEPISVVRKTQTRYEISQQTFEAGDRIIFSESYSPLWVAKFQTMQITSTKTIDGLNQFILPRSYTGSVVITYKVQQVVQWGLWIGIVCCIGYVIVLLYEKKHS